MTEQLAQSDYTKWAHSPAHCFLPEATYIVTGSTYQKKQLFGSPGRLTTLLSTLFDEAQRANWSLQAWAVLSNHYHFIAQAPDDAHSLKRMLQAVHSRTARAVNADDNTPGRRVWFQYWDTCITNERSYLARLQYVHMNPVKHGLVAAAEDYPWCSMTWFLREAEPDFQRTVFSAKCDRISIQGDF